MRARLAAQSVFICLAVACGGGGPTAPTSDSPARSIELGVSGDGEPVLAPGGSLQLWARTHDKDGGNTDITNIAVWQSSDPTVATVSAGGTVRAAKAGPLTVSAVFGKLSATLPLEIINCLATVSPSKVIYSALGGSGTVIVTLGQGDCRWTASSSDPSWLSLFTPPPISGSGQIGYFVQVNNTPQSRTGTITIEVPGGRGAAVSVTQDKPSCSLVLTPAARTVPAAGGSFTVDLSATPDTCDWVVSGFEGGNLRINGPRSGRGNATIAYTLSPNQLTFSPTYTIEARPVANDAPPARHIVTQAR
jgi:hypothetical protein